MRCVLLVNPRSGAGRAARLAAGAVDALRDAGHAVVQAYIGPGLPAVDVARVIREESAVLLIVAGGDGTVRNAASAAIETRTPIYHLPSGNENLFARAFGHTRDPRDLLVAISRSRVSAVDVPVARFGDETVGTIFLLMASIGPDAGVIHRLHASRTSASGHAAYLRPVLDELESPTLVALDVDVNEAEGGAQAPASSDLGLRSRGLRPGLVQNQPGLLVIANTRQYALRIDPCPDADPTDGLLDARFFPADTPAEVALHLARCRLRCPDANTRVARAASFVIRTTHGGPLTVQLDGEALVPSGGNAQRLVVEVSDQRLMVLDAR